MAESDAQRALDGEGWRELSAAQAAGYDPDEQVAKLSQAQQEDHRVLVLDLDGDPDDRAAARFYAARKAASRPALARDLRDITNDLRPGESYVAVEDVRLPGQDMGGG